MTTRSRLDRGIRAEVERLERADLMVGIPSYRNAATIGYVVRAAQAGLVQYFPELRPVLVNSDAGSPDGTGRVVVETEPPDYVERILLVRPTNRLQRVSLTYPEVDGVGGKGAALRTILEIAAELRVEALVVVDSDLRSILPEWIELLAGPILKGGFDFVAPRYERHKYDGTITNTITYPLTRALYGRRIRQPIGGDFGVSADLVRHLLAQDDWTPDVSRFGIDIWMTTHALTGGYAVCEANLGAKIHDPKDPGADLGPMVRQVVATVLRLSASSPGTWWPVSGSREIPAYGFERLAQAPPLGVNAARLLGEFAIAAATTGGACASPEGRLGAGLTTREVVAVREGPDELATDDLSAELVGFHLPDDVWARTIYDLVVAAGRDASGIEALVELLVPIYFGRVASLVIENRGAGADAAEERVERAAREFELHKPYLLARWTEANGAPAEPAPSGTGRSAGTARSGASSGSGGRRR